MNFNLDSIFVEWRAKVPNGVPNPLNDYHLVLLKELCYARNIDKDIVDDVILFLEAKDKSKYAKASGGKYYVKNKETGNVYTVVKPNPEIHDPISREKAEKEEPTDEIDRDSKGYKTGKQKFDSQMENMYDQMEFEDDKEKEAYFNTRITQLHPGDTFSGKDIFITAMDGKKSIIEVINEWMNEKSGWTLKEIMELYLSWSFTDQLKAGSWIPTPKFLAQIPQRQESLHKRQSTEKR